MALKPWETPIEYNEPVAEPDADPGDENDYPASRPTRQRERITSTDDSPLDYNKGPHDNTLGLDDDDERN